MPATDFAIAFAGGVLSFISPCVLPVVPVYLSVTTGLGMAELESPSRRSVLVATRGAGLFIAGFSVVFIALGLSATALGSVLVRNQIPITRVAGIVVFGMALAMLAGTFGRRGPRREWRFHLQPRKYGIWGAPLAGAAFAFGWTPCIGPVLGSVLAVAASEGGLGQGATLLAAYAGGLALPFLLTALVFHRALSALRWTRRHAATLTRGSALVLGGYGALLAFDQLPWLTLRLQEAAAGLALGH